jgi:hypothetical protein
MSVPVVAALRGAGWLRRRSACSSRRRLNSAAAGGLAWSGASSWSQRWGAAGGSALDAVSEVSGAARMPSLSRGAVRDLRRAADIVIGATGPASELSGCALGLVLDASAACGDFDSARVALSELSRVRGAGPGVRLASERHALLLLSPGGDFFNRAGALLSSSDSVGASLWSPCDAPLLELARCSSSGPGSGASVALGRLSAVLDGAAFSGLVTAGGGNKTSLRDGAAAESPRAVQRLARGLLGRALLSPEGAWSREQRSKDLSRALEALEALEAAASSWASARESGSTGVFAASRISELSAAQTSRATTQALLGVTLGALARELHLQSKAVSSEGLYRSALAKLEGCVAGGSFLQHCVKPSLGLLALDYGRLLDEWDKRGGDALKVRERHPAAEPRSHAPLLLDLAPWSVAES